MMKVVILILLGTFVLWIMIRRSTGSAAVLPGATVVAIDL
jgi:hypothetical protein